MTRGAVALAAVFALAACRHARHAPPAEAPPRPEGQDARAEKGAPPAPGHPPVPAAPEGLLAPGEVTRIQRALAARGLLKGHHEGELDTPTSAAIRKFQGERGLAATGFPDRETVRELGIDPEDAYGRSVERKEQASERPQEKK